MCDCWCLVICVLCILLFVCGSCSRQCVELCVVRDVLCGVVLCTVCGVLWCIMWLPSGPFVVVCVGPFWYGFLCEVLLNIVCIW